MFLTSETHAVLWDIGEMAVSAVPSFLPEEAVPRRHSCSKAVLSDEGVAVEVAVLRFLGLWRESPHYTRRQGGPSEMATAERYPLLLVVNPLLIVGESKQDTRLADAGSWPSLEQKTA